MVEMDSTKVLNGTYGELHHEGEWLSNVHGLEVNIEPEYEEVKMPGRRTPGQKLISIGMNGTLQGYTVSRSLAEKISSILNDDNPSFVTELLARMSDPDNPEMTEFYRIKGVQFQKIPGVGYQHGEIVEEEIPFVFTGYEKV